MFMDNQVKMTASTATATMLPQKVIDGFRNGTMNKGQGITKEDLNAALSGLKNEILNDLQNNIEEPKEPHPKPVKTVGLKGSFKIIKLGKHIMTIKFNKSEAFNKAKAKLTDTLTNAESTEQEQTSAFEGFFDALQTDVANTIREQVNNDMLDRSIYSNVVKMF